MLIVFSYNFNKIARLTLISNLCICNKFVKKVNLISFFSGIC